MKEIQIKLFNLLKKYFIINLLLMIFNVFMIILLIIMFNNISISNIDIFKKEMPNGVYNISDEQLINILINNLRDCQNQIEKISNKNIINNKNIILTSCENTNEKIKEKENDLIFLGKGKASWFGGPNDKGIKWTETTALTLEKARKLDPNDYYCAMRWKYKKYHSNIRKAKDILTEKTVRVIYKDKYVDCRPVDWGPSKKTGRIIDLSYGAMKDLGISTDVHDVKVYFLKEK